MEALDYFSSLAACYFIAMSGDPTKPHIAAAQAYVTIQTRRMELHDAGADHLTDDGTRLQARGKVSLPLKRKLNCNQAGVKRQAVLHGKRIKGFDGMQQPQLHEKKGLEAAIQAQSAERSAKSINGRTQVWLEGEEFPHRLR